MISSKKTPLVSIVILNWNGLDDTRICLDNIKKQTYKNYEVIVVDNGSTDGSREYLSQRKDILLISNNENRGFTGGHIDGLAHARGDFILLLNNDAVMKPDLIEKALKTFGDPSVGVVGGRAYRWNEDNPLFDESNEFYSYQYINLVSAEAIFYQKDYGVNEEVNNVSGSCAMVRKSAIDKVGYLENRFFAYYEEADLFARMKRAGYRVVYNPEVSIWHRIGASSNRKSSSFMYYMLFRNRFFFAVRNFESRFLIRFLLSYTKTAIKSTINYLLSRGDKTLNKSFSKAFFYNLLFGYQSIKERGQLTRLLGKSNYNELISYEQENVSHVVVAGGKKEIEKIIEASKNIRPSQEIIIVTKNNPSLSHKLPHNVRFCIDRGYFDTPAENYGALSAKYDLLSFTNSETLVRDDYSHSIDKALGSLAKSHKKCAIFAGATVNNQTSEYSYYLPLIMRREAYIEFGGLKAQPGGLFPLIRYCISTNNAVVLNERDGTKMVQELSKKYLSEVDDIINAAIKLQKDDQTPFYERVFSKYYRLQQLRMFFVWLFSPKIALRTKAGRTRNLALYALRLDRARLATELKHISNEVLKLRGEIAALAQQRLATKKSYDRLSKSPIETPVFIICRDRVTPLLELISWLEKAGLHKIILVDNDSAYPELVKFLNKTKYQVLNMSRNAGHTVVWQQGIIRILNPDDYYIVTDPDVIPVSSGKDTLRALYEAAGQHPEHTKIGLSLKIDDLPDHFSLKPQVIAWESQFWKSRLDENVFEAGVDTTFALYRPYTYKYSLHPSLRLANYTARHLPWYSNDTQPNTEDLFYRLHADQNVTSWNIGELPERYVKELKKQASIR